jgi:hypothetical protein
MPTIFPGGIDSYVNPSAASQLNDAVAPHASSHDNLQDGMTAVQTFVLAHAASLASFTTLAVSSLGTFGGLSVGSNASFQNMTVNGTASINSITTQSLAAFQGIIVAGTASHAGRINAPAVGTSGKPLLNWVPITRQLTTYSAASTAGGFFSMAIASLPSWSPTAYVRLLPLSVNSSTTSMTIALGDGVGNTMQQTQYSVINATLAIGPTELTGLSVASGGCIQPYLSITGPSQAGLQVSLFGYYEPS